MEFTKINFIIPKKDYDLKEEECSKIIEHNINVKDLIRGRMEDLFDINIPIENIFINEV